MRYDHWNRAHPPGIYQVDCYCGHIEIVETPKCFKKISAPDLIDFDFIWKCSSCENKFRPEWTRKLSWIRVSQYDDCLICQGLGLVSSKKCKWCEGKGYFGWREK